MDIQKERELFLAHMRGIGSARFMFELDEDGNFDDMSMSYAWSAWQAAKAQTVQGWISVEDKLPIDGQDVIAFDAIKHCVFKDGEFLQGYFEPDTGHEYEEPVEVTHWMAVEAQEQAND